MEAKKKPKEVKELTLWWCQYDHPFWCKYEADVAKIIQELLGEAGIISSVTVERVEFGNCIVVYIIDQPQDMIKKIYDVLVSVLIEHEPKIKFLRVCETKSNKPEGNTDLKLTRELNKNEMLRKTVREACATMEQEV